MQRRSFTRTFALLTFFGLAAAAVQAGCGDGGEVSGLFEDGDGAAPPPPTGTFDPSGGDGSDGSDADPDALGKLVITPPAATVQVSVVDGVVTVAPVAFAASYSGQPITAQWLFDRGELGAVNASGVFVASGTNVGEGTITARYGAREGTAKVNVVVTSVQNGGPPGQGTGGFGGLGGVGGEPLGVAVAPAVATKLKTESNPPASPAVLGFLYPYDKTVWPRGLLAPLMMWQTTSGDAEAVYVKLSQQNFTFEGTYDLTAQPIGDKRRRVRIDDAAWKTATSGNQGDPLKVEVKILAGGNVIGPITETWTVAAGVLKGTVYYQSYDSAVVTGGGGTGGVLAIKPRSPDPALAIPGAAGKCHVCHSVSADGSTMFAQDGTTAPDDYRQGASYDLKNASTAYATRHVYPKGGGATVFPGAAPSRKFAWSAPYPDGTFALASSRYAREPYLSDSRLFPRGAASTTGDVNPIAAPTFDNVVKSAVTPAFAPDGRKVVFNFWKGPGTNGVSEGDGRSLAIFDFGCGAAAGSVACAPGATRTFSNLREIYRDGARWPAWPSFVPDGKAVIFHNTIEGGSCGGALDGTDYDNCQLTTWLNAKAEIWRAADAAPASASRLDRLNGWEGGARYLPTSASHPDDTVLNYMPTVNPVPSGGYYWVVFTSRRLYGNLLVDDPYNKNGVTNALSSTNKKLWVAAIDIATGAVDPSHPAFYLPGQELGSGNSRGYWVVDPCKANGTGCESGDECCNGFCRDNGNGALVCQDKPPGTQCVEEFEKCTVDADCCDPKQKCIAGRCSFGAPPPVR